MLLIGLSGPELDEAERAWLRCPQVSGVILFARNVQNLAQVRQLNEEIRATAKRPFLIAVDQEGGPVQRLRGEGFTDLPALAEIGRVYASDPERGRQAARLHAKIMASEVRSAGFDLSLAPVADLARGNRAIGPRAFSGDPEACAELVACYVTGMAEAGMAATLKHFPGHGSVVEDTHHELACDRRPQTAWEEADWRPFRAGIAAGARAVMMAHVVCTAFGARPAGAEPGVVGRLRSELGFKGLVMSDDLGMNGVRSLGSLTARLRAHLEAGCDLLLVCEPGQVAEAIAAVRELKPLPPKRLQTVLAAATSPLISEDELRCARVMLARLCQ